MTSGKVRYDQSLMLGMVEYLTTWKYLALTVLVITISIKKYCLSYDTVQCQASVLGKWKARYDRSGHSPSTHLSFRT